jgi:hypothetical protein
MPTSMPAMEQHFRPLKVTDIAPVLKPRDVLAGWRQRQQKGGIQIERNCSDLLYQQMAQAVVDAYGWDNSAHDYGVWLRAFGPEKFSLFLAVDKSGYNNAICQLKDAKFSAGPAGGVNEFGQPLGRAGTAEHVLRPFPVPGPAHWAQTVSAGRGPGR